MPGSVMVLLLLPDANRCLGQAARAATDKRVCSTGGGGSGGGPAAHLAADKALPPYRQGGEGEAVGPPAERHRHPVARAQAAVAQGGHKPAHCAASRHARDQMAC
jgi:hypothetical protein